MADYLSSYERARKILFPAIDNKVPTIAGGDLEYSDEPVVLAMVPGIVGERMDDMTGPATKEMAAILNAGAVVVLAPADAAKFAGAATLYMNNHFAESPPDGDGKKPLYLARTPKGSTLITKISGLVAATGIMIVGPPTISISPEKLAPEVRVLWESTSSEYARKSIHFDAVVVRFVTSIFSGGE